MFGLRVEPPPPVDVFCDGPGPIAFGDYEIFVHHTPGHCPAASACRSGSTANGLDLFVGDTLFAGSIRRTDLPGGNYDTLLDQLRRCCSRLATRRASTPGHGPTTTIGEERRANPVPA